MGYYIRGPYFRKPPVVTGRTRGAHPAKRYLNPKTSCRHGSNKVFNQVRLIRCCCLKKSAGITSKSDDIGEESLGFRGFGFREVVKKNVLFAAVCFFTGA